MSKDAESAAKLKKRTPTNLYNEMPTWLKNPGAPGLDEAAFAANAGAPAVDLSDDLSMAKAVQALRSFGARDISVHAKADEYWDEPNCGRAHLMTPRYRVPNDVLKSTATEGRKRAWNREGGAADRTDGRNSAEAKGARARRYSMSANSFESENDSKVEIHPAGVELDSASALR